VKLQTIKSGDDWYSLAQEIYGSQDNWRELSLINEADIFKALEVGSTLKIPSQGQITQLISAIQTKNPRSIANAALDLSGIKTNSSSEFSIIDWLL
jgi:hypothetical protein